jgi:proteic killer suppression protein
MDLEFNDDDLKRLATDPAYNHSFGANVVTAYRKRVQAIQAAVDERDFYAMKSLRFEKLKGKREHQHSMRLNDQWRLILEFRGKAPNKVVVIISIEDYH